MWKKIILKMLVMLAIFMGIGSYGAYLTGSSIPIFNQQNLAKVKSTWNKTVATVSQPKKIVSSAPSVMKNAVQGEEEKTLFRWKDSQGGIHFGDQPSADATDIQPIRSSELTVNTMKSTPKPKVNNTPQTTAPSTVMPNPYSPSGVKEIMQRAQDVQTQMNQRAGQQQNLLNEL